MTMPLWILAIGAVFAGYWNIAGHFGQYIGPALTAVHEGGGHGGHDYGVMALSGTLAIIGIASAWLLYVKMPAVAERMMVTFGPAYRLLNNKWYVDEIYDACVVRPLRWVGRACWTIDDWGIDGIIWLVTAVPRGLAWILQQMFQRGALQGYALSGAVMIAVILAIDELVWRLESDDHHLPAAGGRGFHLLDACFRAAQGPSPRPCCFDRDAPSRHSGGDRVPR